ncbi:MAG TPA: sigma-70 family RNA polymerase sigma factor [Ohtaekwangia sp.]|uniref:RNA polymerase sigma factor n=1 Tax=Ohtaekwangia sp. TaxID=2066019 RepID=UPI002F91CF53
MEIMEPDTLVSPVMERTKLFEELYTTAFPGVARFISKMNGTLEDAADIFQDALVIFYEKSQHEAFDISASREAYIMGIAKHLWIRKFAHDRKKVSLDHLEASITIPDDFYPAVNNEKLLSLLARSGQKCLELLQAFYYEKLPMKKLAGKFGFVTERSATVQKYKCLEKVRDTIKEKAFTYEDFTE